MSAAHTDLTAWLETLTGRANELEALLAEERSALLNRDAAALQRLSADKLARLQALSTAADDLPARVTDDLSAAGIARWLERRATPAQRTAWSHFTAALERCRQANEANGALLGARYSQIEASLRYLREAAGDLVYGAAGRQAAPAVSQRIARA